MTLSSWQIQQGAACSCKGSDEYCPCQNVNEADPAVWAQRVGMMADRMLEMAPKAGLHVGITIKPAKRDRDASLAEDAQRLSPEGVAARAVTDGIAKEQGHD